MCHLSPTVHLAWAVLASGLQVFLIQHLWRYDRFKCLSWSSGRQPGAFKRIMTYTYLGSVPALTVYAVAMAALKYRNGYSFIPGHGIVPTPFQLWPQSDQDWLRPLYILFSIAWALELVTHLEELFFWLFLLHQGPRRRDWFSSFEFKSWAAGSVCALVGLPLTAIFTRSNPLTSEAYIFLVGSSASMLVTFIFFIVLGKFPAFLRRVKKEGAAGPVVLRLVKFHELNILRVIFRLLMVFPLFVLGVDGVNEHHVINAIPFWTDLLAFVGGVGTVVSSALTLAIFFPRSLAEDSKWRPRTIETHSHASVTTFVTDQDRGRPSIQHRAILSLKPVQSQYRSHSDSEVGNPFDDLEREQERDILVPSSRSVSQSPAPPRLISKYPTGAFSTPSNFVSPFDQTSGGDFELHDMEEGDMKDLKTNPWDASYHARYPEKPGQLREDDVRAQNGGADDQASRLKVRMMELGHAVDEGLKKKPPRPVRLHPYITYYHSPIDLLSWDDENVPRAI